VESTFGMSRRPLRTNFVFNLLYPLARLAVSFVTVPIYMHHVGDARYGVISTKTSRGSALRP
jgi:hypothetical protein